MNKNLNKALVRAQTCEKIMTDDRERRLSTLAASVDERLVSAEPSSHETSVVMKPVATDTQNKVQVDSLPIESRNSSALKVDTPVKQTDEILIPSKSNLKLEFQMKTEGGMKKASSHLPPSNKVQFKRKKKQNEKSKIQMASRDEESKTTQMPNELVSEKKTTLNLEVMSSREHNLLCSDQTLGSEEKIAERIIQQKQQSFLTSTTNQEFAQFL